MPDLDTSLFLSGAVVFLASTTHGAAGFGAALVAMPLLVHWMDIRAVTPLVALLTLTVNAVFLWRFRRALRPARAVFLLAGTAAGVPAGILLLRHGNPSFLKLILGAVLVSWSLYALFTKRVMNIRGARWAFLAGLTSGCLGGAINTGGPPAVLYFTSQDWPKEEVHVTLQLTFFLGGLLVVAGHLLSGLTTKATLGYFVVLLPPLLAGCAAGWAIHRRVNREVYGRLVHALLMVLGLLLLVS